MRSRYLHIRSRDRRCSQCFSESPKRGAAPHPCHSHQNQPERNEIFSLRRRPDLGCPSCRPQRRSQDGAPAAQRGRTVFTPTRGSACDWSQRSNGRMGYYPPNRPWATGPDPMKRSICDRRTAFDTGEYYRSPQKQDPVATFTIPILRTILGEPKDESHMGAQ
jgi:hypothetical protein